MKLAQHYLKETASGDSLGGFNSRLLGDSRMRCMEGTLSRLLRGDPVGDKYVLGLAWAIKKMEEE